MANTLEELLAGIKSCRVCVEQPAGKALPHEPRPVLLASATARIAICGQAPGTRVHASGVPFTDPSGDRLRDWLGISPEVFYDTSRIAIVPMGFCFPGLDDKGGDRPPRRECARAWRRDLFLHLKAVELILPVGLYAQRWHLGDRCRASLTETVRDWRTYFETGERPIHLPLPHPSWRNNAWIRKHPWFEGEVLPILRRTVGELLAR
ncbi:MAG: hypothetical protein RLZ98_2630 [Pseudomonadota bacterium]|jgi:uracil-DNA glycosylase